MALGWMACGRRGEACGEREGDALGQPDGAEGEDGPIAGKMPGEWREPSLGFSVVRPVSLAHTGSRSLAQRREKGGHTVRLRGSRVGATAPASVRIAPCSRGYLTYLLIARSHPELPCGVRSDACAKAAEGE